MKFLSLLYIAFLAFMPFTFAITSLGEDFIPGDIVSVNRPGVDQREGLVVDTFMDTLGRQIVQVQLDRGEVYRAWYPNVRRIVRKTYYTVPQETRNYRTIERIYM